MSLRGLLVLVALLAAGVSLLLWLDRHKTPDASQTPEAPLVRAFTEESLRALELACGGDPVALTHDPSSGWRLARPVEAEADPRRVHEAIAALQDARVRKEIAKADAEPAAYGLAPPACAVRLEFKTGDKPLTLRLGRPSPVGSERYAAGDDGRVVMTDGSVYGVLARGADAFREKRLIPVDPERITRIALDRGDDRLLLQKTDGAWRVALPVNDAASSQACADLSRAVSSIEVSGTASAPSPGKARSDRRIRVEVVATDQTAPRVAYVAAAGIEGTRVAWREGGSLAGLVPESAAGELARPPDAFRERRIASFSAPDVRRITVDRGGTSLRVERTAEGSPWTGASGSTTFPADGARVEALLDTLRGATGTGFEPRAPATPATGTIAVAGEHGELARFSFGPLARASGSDSESVWVTTPARPGAVFKVTAASFGPIPASVADLKSGS